LKQNIYKHLICLVLFFATAQSFCIGSILARDFFIEIDSLSSLIDSVNAGLKPHFKIIELPYNPQKKGVSKKASDNSLYKNKMRKVDVESKLVEEILLSKKDSLLPIVANPIKHKLQIIFTQVNRDEHNIPTLVEHKYLVDDKNYFYPASLVKLPLCALALQKLNELNNKDVNKATPMFTDALPNTCQTKTFYDSSAYNFCPSIEHYIKKMLLVSDNNAYSRTYEFMGRDYIHDRLSEIGLQKVVIRHRFDPNCTDANNAISNPIYFIKNADTVYKQVQFISQLKYTKPSYNAFVGKAHINHAGKKIMQPKNFGTMNYFRLKDVDVVLKRLIFPESFAPEKRFNLTTGDYIFLRKYMSMLPRESAFPKYPDSLYEDSFKKYLLYGNVHGKMQNDSIRIFNIVGQSYGFLSDCAYIVDFKNGVEFFLSVVIYVNENKVINDGIYEYKNVGFPFLTILGKIFYDYELKRKKEHVPDLHDFIFEYK
jgi:hypothetical protein